MEEVPRRDWSLISIRQVSLYLEFIRNDDYKDKKEKLKTSKFSQEIGWQEKIQNSRRTLQVEIAIL
jgi:hypothetical protein